MKLETNEARNQFVLDHYELFDNLAMIHARKVHHIFPSVPVYNLIMNSLDGMLVSLGTVDIASFSWGIYVSRFALLNAISCAILEIGRERGQNELNSSGFRISYKVRREPICDADAQELGLYDDFDALLRGIYDRETAQELIDLLQNTIQHKVVQLFLNHYTLRQISIACHLTLRKIRQMIKSLPNILTIDGENVGGSIPLSPLPQFSGFGVKRKKFTKYGLFSRGNK